MNNKIKKKKQKRIQKILYKKSMKNNSKNFLRQIQSLKNNIMTTLKKKKMYQNITKKEEA